MIPPLSARYCWCYCAFVLVLSAGLEPATSCMSCRRSATELRKHMVEPARIELATLCLQGKCSPDWATAPYWWRRLELNQQPLGYEPNEVPFLYSASNKILAGEAGLEPAECRSQNPVPYQLGYSPILVSAEGFEPSFSSSQARRINLPFPRRDFFALGRTTIYASHNIVR